MSPIFVKLDTAEPYACHTDLNHFFQKRTSKLQCKRCLHLHTLTHAQIKTQQLIAGLLVMSSEDSASKPSAWSLLVQEKKEEVLIEAAQTADNNHLLPGLSVSPSTVQSDEASCLFVAMDLFQVVIGLAVRRS